MNTRYIAEEYRLSHWAKIIQDKNESGLSVRAYCMEKGFHENTYYYWQRKLRVVACEQLTNIQPKTEQTGLIPTSFAEVKLRNEQKSSPNTEAESRINLNIEISGITIKTNHTYPVEQLVHLLRELVHQC